MLNRLLPILRLKGLTERMADRMSESSSQPDSIFELASQLVSLNQRAVAIYSTIVTDIVDGNSADAHLIESTLDGLLGFAGTDDGLILYKKLCRHYWALDPQATVSYVEAYRDMWDDDSVGQ